MFGKTKKVLIGNVAVGADFPVAVQSMTNTDTLDFESTLGQVKKLADAGCDIVRIAVPSEEAAGIFAYVKNRGLPFRSSRISILIIGSLWHRCAQVPIKYG